jgi:copper resistance protein B
VRRAAVWCCAWLTVSIAMAQNHAEHEHQPPPVSAEMSRHIPPDPPSRPMRDMSEKEMIELMDMDDEAAILMLEADAFEWRRGDRDDAFSWDMQAHYGSDYNELLLKTEGEVVHGDTDARTELHWDRVVARWWSVQIGVRHDIAEGPSRTWAAFGVQGLAPYWFEIEATGYVGEEGRTALRVAVDYDLLLTQRWILAPALELNAYGQGDAKNGLGTGLANTELALRLRYEIKRELAPYIGIVWTRLYGDTADLANAGSTDADDNEVEWSIGVRWWF